MATRRATKIVATLGPASSDPQLLEAMIRAGVNVVRLNFSHGKAQDHIDRAATVRAAAQRAGREVAIMADLQGPKIRVGKFAEGKVQLEPGAKFVLGDGKTEGVAAIASSAPTAPFAADFASGQGDVNLQDVMINLQKANLSFQQMVQVRNKLVSAYHDIMNIQV